MKKNVLLACAFALSTSLLLAQTFKLKADESTMKIKGTSSLHDWESVVEKFTATVEMNGETIRKGSLEGEVRSIKSGKSAMDDNTYKAMKADEHPKISFVLQDAKLVAGKTNLSGKLTIAGVTKTVRIVVINEQWAENQIHLTGSYTLKMSDYGIDPPRAVFGTIRTGDEVTILFNLALQR